MERKSSYGVRDARIPRHSWILPSISLARRLTMGSGVVGSQPLRLSGPASDDTVGMTSVAKEAVGPLSQGYQRRVLLAMGLLMTPPPGSLLDIQSPRCPRAYTGADTPEDGVASTRCLRGTQNSGTRRCQPRGLADGVRMNASIRKQTDARVS